MAAFMWGKDGRKLTPEMVKKERELIEAARGRAGNTSPVGHWTQGAARVADALGGVIREKRANKAEAAGLASADAYIQNNPVLAALMGGKAPAEGGSAPSGGAAPSAPPRDPNSPDAVAADTMFALGKINPTDRDILAKTLMAEAGGEGYGGMLAAGAVIDNRRKGGGYGDGWEGVIMKPGQFSAWNGVTGYAGGEGALNMSSMSPSEEAYAAADAILTGNYQDPTGGATHYYNPNVANPKWGQQAGGDWTTIGNHVFGFADAGRGGPSGGTAPSGGGMTPSGQPVPISGGGADVTAALMAAMSDPWVAQKYGPVLDALLGQEMKRGDMQYQAQLAQSDPMYQAQLAELTAPKPVDPWAGTKEIGGVLYGPDGQGGFVPLITPPVDPMDAISLETAQLELDRLKSEPPPAPGAPDTQVFYDDTGREYRAQWDGKAWVKVGGSKAPGGPLVTVDASQGGGKFEEEFAKGDAAALATVSDAGLAATRNLGRIDQLESLLAQNPTGFGASWAQRAGEWGINTEGLSEIQAAQAIINSLVPEQRQPGSGPMSDADLALFKQSLPQIMTQPQGNQIIIDTMRGIAKYDAEGAEIVQKVRDGSMTRAEAFAALKGRKNPLEGLKATPAQGEMPVGTVEDGYRYLGGDPALPGSWDPAQ